MVAHDPRSIPFTPSELAGFQKTQRLAYECAESIARELTPGITEREVAKRMYQWLRNRGIDDWFHKPFVWFGNRTAFDGPIGFKYLKGFNPAFYPTNRPLDEGMPFILDCAPSLDGYTADIGYSGTLGKNPLQEEMMDSLLEYRNLILDMVRQQSPLREISLAVDNLCNEHGYAARHKAYPFETLAHRVEKLKEHSRMPHVSLLNFGLRNLTELAKDRLIGGIEGWSPIWNSKASSNHRPTPGLWAVEPHLGYRGIGVKFEELLVITESDAFWLDQDVPHVRRWQQRGLLPDQKAA